MIAKKRNILGIVLVIFLMAASMALFVPFASLRSEAAKKVTDSDIQAMRDKIASNKEKIATTEKELKELSSDIANYVEIKEKLLQQIEELEKTSLFFLPCFNWSILSYFLLTCN